MKTDGQAERIMAGGWRWRGGGHLDDVFAVSIHVLAIHRICQQQYMYM